MKKITFSFKSLLVAAGLLLGSANAWAQDPTPVYFNDFSSTDGLTIVGNGEFIKDADPAFGQVFHNDPTNSSAIRTNYLKLPSNVLSHSATSNEMTIGFWVNKKDDDNYFYSPLFAAYAAAPNPNNTFPMLVCEARGLIQLNNSGYCDFGINGGGVEFNDGTPYVNTAWLDDMDWHYYTVVFTTTTAKVYVDGELKNGWTVDGTTAGQVISGLFAHGEDLSYVTLGGNQAWSWGDPDPAFAFDDFAVYDEALNASQIAAIISAKGKTDYSSVYERTSASGVNQWADADITAWGSAANLAIDGENRLGFNGVVGNASYAASTTANALVKYEVEWYAQSTANDQTNPAYLQLGSLVIKVRDSYQSNLIAFSTDGGSSFGSEKSTKNTAKWLRDGKTITVRAILNSATNTIECLNLSFDGVTYTTKDLPNTTISNANTIGLKTEMSGTWTPSSKLNSIKVSELTQAVTNVKIVESSGVVGQTVNAESVIDGTEVGYVGNHYLITAAEAPSMTLVNGENILNVPVRAPYTATLNVTRTIGGVAQTPVVTNLVETDAKVCAWNYTYPMYVQKDGVYYVADVTSSFGESGTFTNGETINKTVAYSNPDYSVVYFGEPNEVTGTNTAYSNGATGFITGGVKYDSNNVIRLGQLAAGTYRLITNITGDAARNLVVGDYTAGTESFPTALVTITTTGAKDESFTVDGTQLISISGKDQGGSKFNQSATVDYILVKASSASATIGATGYTTFASSYALDLLNMSASTGDVTAYIASAQDGTNVTLNVAPDDVQAGEGLVLKGTAGATITIPVIASSANDPDNLLVGCPTATEITAEMVATTTKYYVIANNGGTAQFQYLNAAITIPAGKAYLPVTTGGVKSLNIIFGDGTATGVDAPAVAEAEEEEILYNTTGVRVGKDYKGIVIKNGKKYLNK